MVVWDFHKENPAWLQKFDFVYSNSLDQAMNPEQVLSTWARQIKPHGRLYIEHSLQHSPAHAGAADPFGAHPMVMPYLLFKWGKGQYHLNQIIEHEREEGQPTWVFVLTLEQSQGQ